MSYNREDYVPKLKSNKLLKIKYNAEIFGFILIQPNVEK